MFVSPSSMTRLRGIDLGIDLVWLFSFWREDDEEQSFPQKPRDKLRLLPDELPGEIVHCIRVFEDLNDFTVDIEGAVEFAAHEKYLRNL